MSHESRTNLNTTNTETTPFSSDNAHSGNGSTIAAVSTIDNMHVATGHVTISSDNTAIADSSVATVSFSGENSAAPADDAPASE